MVRYYFHLHDRFGRTEDEIGQELADLGDARKRALKAARAIIQADVASGVVDLTARIIVVCGDNETVLTLPFGGAINLITAS